MQRGQCQALFSGAQWTEQGNGCKLIHGILPLNIITFFLSVRVTEHWHQMPREVTESSSFEIFKSHWDTLLCNQLYFEQWVWTRWLSENSVNFNHFVTLQLWFYGSVKLQYLNKIVFKKYSSVKSHRKKITNKPAFWASNQVGLLGK